MPPKPPSPPDAPPRNLWWRSQLHDMGHTTTKDTLSEELTPAPAWDGEHPEHRECHFVSWNGTAPINACWGESRHRLSAAGTRRTHSGLRPTECD